MVNNNSNNDKNKSLVQFTVQDMHKYDTNVDKTCTDCVE